VDVDVDIVTGNEPTAIRHRTAT